MFTGWPAAALNVHSNKDGAIATLMEWKAYGDTMDPETSSSITRITSRTEQTGDAEVILQKDTMGDVSLSLAFPIRVVAFGDRNGVPREL
jgi:hypothetical protein